MAKKTRMGRNLNALLGGATRTRPENAEESKNSVDVQSPDANKPASDEDSSSISTTKTTAGQDSSATVLVKDSANSQVGASSDAQIPTLTTKPALDAKPDHAKSASVMSVEKDANSSSAAAVRSEVLTIQADSHPTDRLRMLGVDQITRGTYQPRRHFDQDLLQELADSITAQGLIQPILVRAYGGKFELIAGERRWRASQLAGITDIPAIVRDMDDQSVASVSLIENIQRADLNPLEEAQALERLCGEFSMTHQQVAEAVGRSRVAVTNLMRLLELHDDVKSMVDKGELDMGHARALLGAPRSDQPGIAKRITQQGLTVRAVEKLVKNLREGKSLTSSGPPKTDPNIEALGQKLGKLLGAPVSIKHQQSGSGKLEINYSSVDELEGILSHIK